MNRPYVIIVEYVEDKKPNVFVFSHVYAESRGDALNYVQGFMDLKHPNAYITRIATGDNYKIRDYDAIREPNPYSK